jgi:NADPH:quinone reductase-like Zn-dependent oxidoreductase
MKAVILDRYGSKDGARVGEMPEPESGDDDVLVQVHAAGVTLLDSKIRDGEFKLEALLHDYDVVLNSQDGRTLEKSVRVLRPGGKLISISGPPDPEFGKAIGSPWFVTTTMRLLSLESGEGPDAAG